VGFFQLDPDFLTARFFAGEDGLAVAAFDFFNEDLDVVANLDFRVFARLGEFLDRDAAFGFQTNVDDDEIVGDADDRAGDDIAFKFSGTSE
jgi:hypothetical protein